MQLKQRNQTKPFYLGHSINMVNIPKYFSKRHILELLIFKETNSYLSFPEPEDFRHAFF